MKREYYYLIAVLLVAIAFRAYNYRLAYFIDNDAFLHASVIRQAMTDGNLRTYELSYGGPSILEPLGFYYIAMIPAYLIGLESAMLLMPLLFGVACVLITYFLAKDLFNSRVALIASLILALSLAHAYRTSPYIYRGDGFYLTVFLISLYYFTKSFQKNKYALITGITLGLSAAVWNGYPLGVIVIIGGLIIKESLLFIKGELKKDAVIKSALVIIPYFLLEVLFLSTGVTKAVFFDKDLIIVIAPIVIGLIFLASRKVKKTKVFAVMTAIGIVLLLINYRVISDVIAQGLFEGGAKFYKVGISELLPPSYDLLFTMLSWSLYTLWPGLVMLALLVFYKKRADHATLLIFAVITIYLMLSYSRYNFLASANIAILSGIFLDYVYVRARKLRILGIILLGLFLVPYATDSLTNINKIGPRMNDYWLDALTYLKTQPRGEVLTWWDHGSWVQYYSTFPTIVDSVNGQDVDRITRIAKFLTGNATESFADWNVSYVVLGGDVILYSGAVSSIAGATDLVAAMVQPATEATNGEKTMIVYPMGEGWFEIYPEGSVYRTNEGAVVMNRTFFANKTGTTVKYSDFNNTQGCLVINPTFNLYMNDKECNTNYASLMYGTGLPGMQLIYRNDYVVIYKVL